MYCNVWSAECWTCKQGPWWHPGYALSAFSQLLIQYNQTDWHPRVNKLVQYRYMYTLYMYLTLIEYIHTCTCKYPSEFLGCALIHDSCEHYSPLNKICWVHGLNMDHQKIIPQDLFGCMFYSISVSVMFIMINNIYLNGNDIVSMSLLFKYSKLSTD